MNLRKTVTGGGPVYRIFELAPNVFHVLDPGGRTVDEFTVVEIGGGASGVSVKQAFRHGTRRVGVPDLARTFVSELNATRKQH